MAKMQIAIRFWRKAGANLGGVGGLIRLRGGGTGRAAPGASRVFVPGQIIINNIANEIGEVRAIAGTGGRWWMGASGRALVG